MSKRASKNSVKFSGKNWANGRMRNGINKKKKKKKKTKKEKQFELLSEKFNFNIENNRKLYIELFSEFKKITPFKKRTEIINKVESFKKVCNQKNTPFHIAEYILDKHYEIDFYKEYPKLFKRKSNNKRKMILEKGSGNKISDFMSNEIITKLKNKLSKK